MWFSNTYSTSGGRGSDCSTLSEHQRALLLGGDVNRPPAPTQATVPPPTLAPAQLPNDKGVNL